MSLSAKANDASFGFGGSVGNNSRMSGAFAAFGRSSGAQSFVAGARGRAGTMSFAGARQNTVDSLQNQMSFERQRTTPRGYDPMGDSGFGGPSFSRHASARGGDDDNGRMSFSRHPSSRGNQTASLDQFESPAMSRHFSDGTQVSQVSRTSSIGLNDLGMGGGSASMFQVQLCRYIPSKRLVLRETF